MDNASYFVESAVMQAPLERCIADPNQSIFFLVPNATASAQPVESKVKKLSSATAGGAVKVEIQISADFTTAVTKFADDSDDWVINYLSPGVEPITAKLVSAAKSHLKNVNTFDSIASDGEDQSRIALRAVLDSVEDYIKNKDLWSLNEMLGLVEPSSLRKITSVAFLRTSFRVRDKLSNWTVLYKRTEAYLLAEGLDARRALRGLDRSKGMQIG
ncbi:hypothetical protein [Pseudomonas zeae]|uniref:hypothetical protein n=1 Tax=Pseudomonas zeae TaxID=2745510 RepID=UPI003D017449